MPAPLTEEMEKTCWRIPTADLELLRLVFPGRVNEVVRVVLGVYCERVRSGLKAQQDQAVSDTP